MTNKSNRKLSGFIAIGAAVLLIGCQQSAPKDHTAEHKPAVDAFIDAWNTGNYDQLDTFFADGFKRRAPGFAMNAVGLSGMKDVMRALRGTYPDANLVVDDAYFQENLAFVRWTFSGTNTGPGDFPPTGKPVKNSGLTILHYANGKIAMEDVYFDTLEWMQQLGFTLTPSSAE